MGLLDYIKANTPRSTKPRVSPATVINQGLLNPNQFNKPQADRFKDSLFGMMGIVPGVGDAASVAESADLFNRGENFAGSMAALGALPLVPAIGGMFIGKGAKTFDFLKAKEAEEMLAKGIDPREVWKQTGTMRGGDGFLRQEIPDNMATLSGKALPTQYIEGFGDVPSWKVKDVLAHDPLYKAYPDTAGIESSFAVMSHGAEYKPNADWISYNKELHQAPVRSVAEQAKYDDVMKQAKEFYSRPDVREYNDKMFSLGTDFSDADFYKLFNKEIEDEASRIADLRLETNKLRGGGYSLGSGMDGSKSTTLHELQHAIQEREGWAKGGAADYFNQQDKAQLARDALVWKRELLARKKQFPEADVMNLQNKAVEDYQQMGMMDWLPSREARDLAAQPWVLYPEKYGADSAVNELEEIVKTYGLDKRATPYSGQDIYKRLLGEAEARLTQARMGMSMDERLASYPYDMLDVPIDQLIVRGLLK